MRKPWLGIGFTLSAITDFLLLFTALPLLLGAFYLAFGTYPLSVIIRGIGWIKLGRESRVRLFKAAGSAVIILGLLFYVSLLAAKEPRFSIIVWIVYSLMEFSAYVKVSSTLGTRLIGFACISIIGIATVVWIAVPDAATLRLEALPRLSYAFIFLLASSLIAAVSFLRK